jgi:hypothetical protein
MRHPLEFVPDDYRKRIFLTLLVLTLSLFAVFRVLDQPLRTPAAPNGIVSFELAGRPEKAFQILVSWVASDSQQPEISRIRPYLFAAFGLGLDYLFMPIYAFALAFGTLLAAGRHAGWVKSLGAVAGWGAFAAAGFDAVENFALWHVLLFAYDSPYPLIAAICAATKFALLIFGLLYALIAWLLPAK